MAQIQSFILVLAIFCLAGAAQAAGEAPAGMQRLIMKQEDTPKSSAKYTASGRTKYERAEDAEAESELDRVWEKYKDLAAGTTPPETKEQAAEAAPEMPAEAPVKPKRPKRLSMNNLSPRGSDALPNINPAAADAPPAPERTSPLSEMVRRIQGQQEQRAPMQTITVSRPKAPALEEPDVPEVKQLERQKTNAPLRRELSP